LSVAKTNGKDEKRCYNDKRYCWAGRTTFFGLRAEIG